MRMNRKRRHLAQWLQGDGIEIGALHNPLELPEGARARYVDRMSTPDLALVYPELAGQPLVEVDVIARAEDLSPIPSSSLDFVIANHLIEHVEDPISALAEMSRVLRPGGVLYMAVPEPRVTFDRERALTTVEHLVDEFRNGAAANREAHYRDWVENAEPIRYKDEPRDKVGEERVQELMQRDESIHFHVFSPEVFLGLVAAGAREAGALLQVAEFVCCDEVNDDEFVCVLVNGPYASLPRLPGSLVEREPPPEPPPSRAQRIRRRVAASPAGPVLRPLYRAAKKLAGSGTDG